MWTPCCLKPRRVYGDCWLGTDRARTKSSEWESTVWCRASCQDFQSDGIYNKSKLDSGPGPGLNAPFPCQAVGQLLGPLYFGFELRICVIPSPPIIQSGHHALSAFCLQGIMLSIVRSSSQSGPCIHGSYVPMGKTLKHLPILKNQMDMHYNKL